MADEPKPAELRVMADPQGHGIARKLFDRYVRKEDKEASFAKFPSFAFALDKLVSEFGGTPVEDESSGDSSDDSADSVDDAGDSYDDDEDIHAEASEVDRVRDAVTATLKSTKK